MHKKFTSLKWALVLLFAPAFAFSQVVVNESFDGVTFPPLGWNSAKIAPSSDVNNYCERVTTSTNPAGFPNTPRTGPGMLSYRSSYMTVGGEKAYIATRPLDMSNMPAGGATGSFWMYRDNNSAGFADSVSLYVNDSSSIFFTGGTIPVSCLNIQMVQQIPISPCAYVNRYYNNFPAVATPNGWYQYTFTIPQVLGVTNISKLSVVILFTNRHTGAGNGNIYIDDFTVNTYPKKQTFISADMVFQNSAIVPQNSINNMIGGINVVVDGDSAGGTNGFVINSFSFSTVGSTNACGDAQNAKLWWTKGTNTWNGIANAVQVGATVAAICGTNYSFTPGAAFHLDNGNNYFWITYDIKPVGVSTPGNCVDIEFNSLELLNGANPGVKNASVGTLAGCRVIDVAYCGGSTPTYSTGTSWLGGSYTQNDYVAQVILTGEAGYPVINNSLNCCGPPIAPWFGGPAPFSNHPPDYELFAAVPGKTTALKASSPATNYNITLKVGTWIGSNYIAAWIDFDHDGVFALTERIAMSGALAANGTYTTSFSVPSSAYIGATTLRVREVYAQPNIDPCASYTFGETEDYVVTIIPDCNVFSASGYNKVWLGGFDNDWNNALNWCPAAPPLISDNTLIPGGSPNRPEIKEGYSAVSKKLKIQGTDSLFINAYSSGSLIVTDSLTIANNASMLKVTSAFADTAQVSNGNLYPTTPPYYPFNGAASKQRCQLVYTQAELAAQGLLTGDEIDSIYFLVSNFVAPGNPYLNLTISYYYTSPAFSYGGAGGTNALAPILIPGGTVYTNPSYSITGVGQYKIKLTTPITWNPTGANYSLVINICYNHTAGGGQQSWYTPTTGNRRYLQVYAAAAGGLSACSLSPSIRALWGSGGAAGTNTVTLGIFLQSYVEHIAVGMTITGTGIPAGTTITSIAGNTVTMSANATAQISGTITITSGTLTSTDANCTTQQRPNLTFHFKRNYFVYPIAVGGHWTNNGTWIAGKSNVKFNGNIGQRIDGTNSSTYYNMEVSTPSALNTVQVWKDVTVTDTLRLTSGRLVLNGNPTAIRSLSLLSNNGSPGNLIRTAGVLVAETNPPNYGMFRWQMGTPSVYPQTFIFPFGDVAGNYIPFDYKLNAGSGDITMTTYKTAPNNTPIPTGVSDIYQNTWIAPPFTDNSPWMVDRFYQINEAGTSTNRDFTFRFASPAEDAALGASPYRAQVYHPSTNWGWPFIVGQSNPSTNAVTVPAVNYTNTWALVRQQQPLPVELLSFDAKTFKDQHVITTWTTASEQNSDFFTVERSKDGYTFEKAGTVKGAGNTNELKEYRFVDETPYRGISYYRLRQTDFNGKSETFERVAVNLSLPATTVTVYPVPASEQVVFSVDKSANLEQAVLVIYDFTGRTVLSKKVGELKGSGTNIFVLPLTNIQNGIYHFELKVEDAIIGNGKFICDK